MRGTDRDLIRGDAILLTNFEYIKGYSRLPSFRTSYFADLGNVYKDASAIRLDDIQTSLGIGLRWKISSFVKTDLFVDFAHNIDTDNNKVYAGTSLIF